MKRIQRVINQGDRYYCDHCDEYLGKTTYFKHKKKYANLKTHLRNGFDAPDPFTACTSSSEDEVEEDQNVGQHDRGFLKG